MGEACGELEFMPRLCPKHIQTPLLTHQITGTIEEHEEEALEVDFANAYLGGGALSMGKVFKV